MLTVRFAQEVGAVEALLQAGANPNRSTDSGKTVLMYAAERPDASEQLELLINHGADVQARDDSGRTALFYAARADSAENVRLLLQSGASVSVATPETDVMDPQPVRVMSRHEVERMYMGGGITPLMEALSYGAGPQVVRMLLEAGADVNALNDDNNTPFLYAVRENAVGIDALVALLEAGADVDEQPEWSMTALMYAIVPAEGEPRFEIIEFLLDAGADASATDGTGRTAFDLARFRPEFQNTAVLRRLRAAVE